MESRSEQPSVSFEHFIHHFRSQWAYLFRSLSDFVAAYAERAFLCLCFACHKAFSSLALSFVSNSVKSKVIQLLSARRRAWESSLRILFFRISLCIGCWRSEEKTYYRIIFSEKWSISHWLAPCEVLRVCDTKLARVRQRGAATEAQARGRRIWQT